MLNKEGIAALYERLNALKDDGTAFFDQAQQRQSAVQEFDATWTIWEDLLTPELRKQGETIRNTSKRLSIDIAGAARGAPLIAEADLQDLRLNTRRMLASIHFHQYRQYGVNIHHDEGIVLGVDPPSQEENPLNDVSLVRHVFNNAATSIGELIDLLSPTETIQPTALGTTAAYRPNTAFILMAIDDTNPELEDVKNAITDVCKEFGITAVRADDIEHDGAITDRILEEIETSEFLIADLTHERPSVYYEIGHAHAKNKRVNLYRKKGTRIHFDLAHRNCPEYDNITDLKNQLRKRLETLTNKPQQI